MRPNNFSGSCVFCSRMFCFIFQTSECFRWVSLTYNHSVVATVCWNAVTSVKNISSCGRQKSTVIVSFFLVYGSVFTTHRSQQNVKPPVSHSPISKETVFRKIYFIFAYAETIIKRFSKGVSVAFARHSLLVFCAVLWNRSCRQTTLQKVPMIFFASILQSDHYGISMHRTITATSHCQHSHNVIHSFRSSTKYKTFCCLIFV